MNTKSFIIYYHKSPVNKYYIGITSKKSVISRWHLDGSGYKSQKKFWEAIQEFGWQNFEHGIIGTGLTKAEACDAEQFFIQIYNSKNNGYNSNDGGTGNLGHTVSKDSRKIMSQLKKGITKEHFTDAQKAGIIAASQSNTKNVYCYNLDGILVHTFFGFRQAAEYYKIPKSTAVNCCNSQLVYHQQKLIFVTDKNKETVLTTIEKYKLNELKKCKPTIEQYDTTGNLLNSFLTYKDAAFTTGIPIGSISKVCSGFELKYKNYIFIKIGRETIKDRLAKITAQYKRNYAERSYIIQQFDLDNNLLGTYDSYTAAAIATNIAKKLIIANCTGKCNTCKKYKFKKLTQ